jgi:hypothetical protein
MLIKTKEGITVVSETEIELVYKNSIYFALLVHGQEFRTVVRNILSFYIHIISQFVLNHFRSIASAIELYSNIGINQHLYFILCTITEQVGLEATISSIRDHLEGITFELRD